MEVGDVDTWDCTISVTESSSRTLSEANGLLGELLGTGAFGPGGLPGAADGPGDCPMQ